jgi:hypothetical protein
MSPDIDLYVIGLYVQQMVIINEIQNSSLGAKASRQSELVNATEALKKLAETITISNQANVTTIDRDKINSHLLKMENANKFETLLPK